MFLHKDLIFVNLYKNFLMLKLNFALKNLLVIFLTF